MGMAIPDPVDETHNTRNYFAHGGHELVIGGKLTILPEAEVEGLESEFESFADELMEYVQQAAGVQPVPQMQDSTATTVAALKDDFNQLLSLLRESGLLHDRK